MTDQIPDQVPTPVPTPVQTPVQTQIQLKKQALVTQVKSLREIFDKAHSQAIKAQEAFELVKHEIHQIQFGADEEVIAVKAEADLKIDQILQEIEVCKREAEAEIARLRHTISEIRMPSLPVAIPEREPDQD